MRRFASNNEIDPCPKNYKRLTEDGTGEKDWRHTIEAFEEIEAGRVFKGEPCCFCDVYLRFLLVLAERSIIGKIITQRCIFQFETETDLFSCSIDRGTCPTRSSLCISHHQIPSLRWYAELFNLSIGNRYLQLSPTRLVECSVYIYSRLFLLTCRLTSWLSSVSSSTYYFTPLVVAKAST